MLWALAVSLSLSLGAAPAAKPAAKPAEKSDADKAKDLFKTAQKLYKQARYPEAIAKFEEAYLLRPHAVIYFNIGKCHEQLGDVGKAMRAYKDYLRLSPEAPDREVVADAIANLERRLKDKGLQQLMVYADPPTAQVEVDGKPLGNSPASIELPAGNHKLAVTAEGYEKVERSFVMQTTRSMEMTINLRELPKATPPVAAAPADAPKATELRPPADPPVVVKEQPVGPARGRTWTWVAAGTSVVAAGAGVAMGMSAAGASSELLSGPHSRAEADALVGRANSMALGANVSYGLAAAAAVTAGVLFFVEGKPSTPAGAMAMAPRGFEF